MILWEEKEVINAAETIHAYLKNRVIKENIGIILYKALPSPIDKIKNKYRWRILIKCKFSDEIINLRNFKRKSAKDFIIKNDFDIKSQVYKIEKIYRSNEG